MLSISSKRIQGAGKGIKMGFPTINFVLDELPSGIEVGLYATITSCGKVDKSMSLISKGKSNYRIETHVLVSTPISVLVGDNVTLTLLGKLREPIKTRDIKSMIDNDTALVNDYFKNFKTCTSCSLCFIQDYGYSNYTVEGSNIGCYADVFEESEYSSYGNESITEYNSFGCTHMVPGEAWDLDVDGENEKPTEGWLISIIRDSKLNKILG